MNWTRLSILGLALGTLTQYPVLARESQVTLRKECTVSRCVYYKGSSRVFSAEKEQGTQRTIIRDRRGNLLAKTREYPNGTIKIERAYSGR